MLSKLTSIFVFIFYCAVVHCQNIQFTASADATQILENSYLQVEFTLENANGSAFLPPDFGKFKVVGGPSTMTSHTMVNGKISRSLSYSYNLQASSPGVYEIGAASIIVNGNRISSNTLTIEVVKSEGGNESRDLFVKTILSDSIAYVGQQVILEYRLYTKLNVRTYNFLSTDEYDGFYVEQLRSFNNRFRREIIDGVEYYTKSIKKLALFPQQTGSYSIDPVDVKLGIAGKNSSRGIFMTSQMIPKVISAEGATIVIENLPESPASFSGAVGDYNMQVSNKKNSLTTDEAISIIMQIVGNGDNKTVQAPEFVLPKGLTMYDPNIIEDEVFPDAQGVKHRKTFEYLIVAKEPGRYNIVPEFSYFNPDSARYIQLKGKLRAVTVLKGSNTTIAEESSEERIGDIITTTRLKSISEKWYLSTLHLLTLGILFIGIVLILAYKYFLIKTGRLDPVEIRKRKAYQVAKKKLETAHVHLQNNNSKEFYEAVSIAIKKYLSDKYQFNAMSMTTDDIILQLENAKIDPQFINRLKELMNTAEIAIYSPSTHNSRTTAYSDALELISALES